MMHEARKGQNLGSDRSSSVSSLGKRSNVTPSSSNENLNRLVRGNSKSDLGVLPKSSSLDKISKSISSELLNKEVSSSDKDSNSNTKKSKTTYVENPQAIPDMISDLVKTFEIELAKESNSRKVSGAKGAGVPRSSFSRISMSEGSHSNPSTPRVMSKSDSSYGSMSFSTSGIISIVRDALPNIKSGANLIHYAASHSAVILKSLLTHFPFALRTRDTYQRTPIHYAIAAGNIESVKVLIDLNPKYKSRDKEGNTPILYSCSFGHSDIFKLLFKDDPDVNIKGFADLSLLHTAVLSMSHDIVQILVENGDLKSINAKTRFRNTALHFAIATGSVETAQYLIEHGAKIDVKNRLPLSSEFWKPNNRFFLGELSSKNSSFEEDKKRRFRLRQETLYKQVFNMPDYPDLVDAVKDGISLGRAVIIISQLLQKVRNGLISADPLTIGGLSPLHFAAIVGSTELIELCLKNNVDINETSYENFSAIHYATFQGNVQAVEKLIESGIEIDGPASYSGYSPTPLHLASLFGYVDIANILLKSGANPWALSDKNMLPIHHAAEHNHVELVNILLTSEKDSSSKPEENRMINAMTTSRITPLHSALSRNHYEMAKLLIERGASLSLKTTGNNTPYILAIMQGNVNYIKLMMSYNVDINERASRNRTALHIAVRMNHVQVVKKLIKYKNLDIDAVDDDGNSALGLACSTGNVDCAEILLDVGADHTLMNNNQMSLLHLAALYGFLDCINAIILKYPETEIINSRDKWERIPLHLAASSGNLECLVALIAAGSDINALDEQDRSTLFHAVNSGNYDVVEYLINENIVISNVDHMGLTPFHLAAGMGSVKIVKLLHNHTKFIKFLDDLRQLPIHWAALGGHVECMDFFIMEGMNYTSPNINGSTPLHLAAAGGHVKIITMLKEAITFEGANVQDNKGWSPLHEAVSNNHASAARKLIEYGASVNLKDSDGNTPLHVAAFWGSSACIQVLLDSNPDLSIINNFKETPLHIAISAGHMMSSYILSNAGYSVVDDTNGPSVLEVAFLKADIVLLSLIVKIAQMNKHRFDKPFSNGSSPLHIVVRREDPKILAYLLKNNLVYDINSLDSTGRTPLCVAGEYSSPIVVKFLLEYGGNMWLEDHEGFDPFHYAALYGNNGVLHMLINHYIENRDPGVSIPDAQKSLCEKFNSSNVPPIHLAFRARQLESVSIFLKLGVDINCVSLGGETLLHAAVRYDLKDNLISFIDKGSNLNAKTNHGDLPIHFAARWGSIESIKLFLTEYDVDPNIKGREENSPIHFAVEFGHLPVVMLLINSGADINVTNMHGVTPFTTAIKNSQIECASLLLEHGANMNVVDNYGRNFLHYLAMFGKQSDIPLIEEAYSIPGFDFDLIDNNGFGAIHYAITNHNDFELNILDALLNYGANVDVVGGENGLSPLHLACLEGNVAAAKVILANSLNNSSIGVSMSQEKLIESKSIHGCTALYLAASSGFVETLEFLLSAGADIFSKNTPLQMTPLQIATHNEHFGVVKVLLEEYSKKMGIGERVTFAVDRSGQNALHIAATNGNAQICRELLIGGFKVHIDDRDRDSMPAVYYAVKNGHIPAFNILVQFGADVRVAYSDGRSLLHHAMAHGQFEIGRILLSKHVNPNALDATDMSPIHWAVLSGNTDCIKMLYDHKADLSALTFKGVSPLHIACTFGDCEMASVLVGLGARLNVSGPSGWTALHEAAANGYFEITQFLIGEDANIFTRDRYGKTPLHAAAYSGTPLLIKLLCQAGCKVDAITDFGETAFHFAIVRGNLDCARALVTEGAEISASTSGDLNALHLAAKYGRADSARYLITSCGFDVNSTTSEGLTPLHLAVRYGHYEMTFILLFSGAIVNSVDNYGWSPLFEAAASSRSKLAEMLIEYGADVEIEDLAGMTPIHQSSAAGHTHTTSVLLNAGANYTSTTRDLETPLHLAAQNGRPDTIRLLVEHGAFLGGLTRTGESPLHLAADSGFEEAVVALLSLGADVERTDQKGLTALHIAAKRGDIECGSALLNSVVNVNVRDNEGNTPLHYAAFHSHAGFVALLLKKNADLEVCNNVGKTPVQLAYAADHPECLRYLVEKGASVNIVDYKGRSLIHDAAQKGDSGTIGSLLSHGMYIDLSTNIGETPLYIAIINKQQRCIKLLVERGANLQNRTINRNSLIHACASVNNLELLKIIRERLGSSFFPDLVNDDGETALHIAASKGYNEVCQFLISCDSSPHIVDKKGRLPLHLAAQNGFSNVAETLVESGSLIDEFDHNYLDPLMLACLNDHLDCSTYLSEKVENVDSLRNFTDSSGMNILHLCCKRGAVNVLHLLIDRGIHPDFKDPEGFTPLHHAAKGGFTTTCEILFERGANPNISTARGVLPIHMAAFAGDPDCLELFLNDDNLNVATRFGATPLSYACQSGKSEECALAENAIDANAYHMSSIIRAYNGKTVEIGNTDAEGRLVLADTLSYVEDKFKPSTIVDMATLTGSQMVALGAHCSALFAKDDDLADELLSASKNTFNGELLWRMPTLDAYGEMISSASDHADMNNVAGREGGVCTAAAFLRNFVSEKTQRYAHIDIAGPAMLNSSSYPWNPKGANGFGVDVCTTFFNKLQME